MPFILWIVTPWIRPFRWKRLLWTYPFPMVPVTCTWDGVVSQLRAYSPEELKSLVAPLADSGYTWKIGKEKVPATPGHVTYLLGYPDPAKA